MNDGSNITGNLIERTLHALADPNQAPTRDVYLVLLLSLFAGLRRMELIEAHGGWLDVRGMEPKMSVWSRGREIRVVPVQPVVATCLNAMNRWDGVHFIEGADKYRRETLFAQANAWLYGLGWGGSNPRNHLRRVFCVMTACTWGWERAQSAMGYSSMELTQKAAGDLILVEEEVVLWEEFRPVMPRKI